MLQIFHNFDIDKNGSVTRTELATVLQCLDAAAWTTARIDKLVDVLDKNHDGAIDYEDFVAWLCSTGPDVDKKDQRDVMSTSKTIVTLDKLKKLLGAKAGEAFFERLLDHLFNHYDADGDGLLDRMEFLTCEERRFKLNGETFGRKERTAALDWFKASGAEGDLKSGMTMDREKFKEAMVSLARSESGLAADDFDGLAEWTWTNRAKSLLESKETSTFSKLAERFHKIGSDSLSLFCVRFSSDDEYIAASFDTGDIQVLETASGKKHCILSKKEDIALPITMIRWRPIQKDADPSGRKPILVSVGADGRIMHWDVATRKLVSEISETGNELYSLDYRPDGLQFATGGKLHSIQVYDEAVRKPLFQMDGYGTEGHSNRVFSLKYHPTDPNILLTGSWDNMVKVWDTRAGSRHAIKTLGGPCVHGDTVDMSSDGETVLTGSFSTTKQLQTWSFKEGKVMDTHEWKTEGKGDAGVCCKVYAAQFSKHDGSSMILAGGSGAEEVKLFDWKDKWSSVAEVICPGESDGWCQSVDWSNTGDYLAVGTSKGAIRVMNTF